MSRIDWEVVIGLEVHSQLNTHSKIFSGASTEFGKEPNVQASAVDIALPGVLPVLNRGAVERAIRFGLAVGAHIAPKSVFARKNYFYPDLPKGYQISQFELPVVQGGGITILVPDGKGGSYEKRVNLTRAHLEEDAGKSLHEDFHGMTGIDLNRAGTPLLEIVSEPEMRSSAEAVAYARALHALVRWIDICDGNMQEGSFRCDANVSVRPRGQAEFGTRREIKNLNSFRFMQQAIDYEVQWQIDLIEDGGKVQQATVLFDADTGETRSMRSKEDAHDYRYFPDPDLLPLVIADEWVERVRSELPELPAALRARLQSDFGLSAYDAAALTTSQQTARYYLETLEFVGAANAKICANWVIGNVATFLNTLPNESPQGRSVTPRQLAGIVLRIVDGTISNKIGKELFDEIWTGFSTNQMAFYTQDNVVDLLIEKNGLRQMTDAGAIDAIIDQVLAANPKSVEEFRAGKEKAFNALVGQVMKASKGKANPAQASELLKKKLG